MMKRLLDPSNNYLKTEKNIRKYLKKLSDSQIELFYEAIEYTPFPILVTQEYSRRFKSKNKRTNIRLNKQNS